MTARERRHRALVQLGPHPARLAGRVLAKRLGRAGSRSRREVALDQRSRKLPLAIDDREPVQLEVPCSCASEAKLLALEDERRVELNEGLGIVPPGAVRTRRNQLPQSHGRSIGATAPKLRPAPHMGEATKEVG